LETTQKLEKRRSTRGGSKKGEEVYQSKMEKTVCPTAICKKKGWDKEGTGKTTKREKGDLMVASTIREGKTRKTIADASWGLGKYKGRQSPDSRSRRGEGKLVDIPTGWGYNRETQWILKPKRGLGELRVKKRNQVKKEGV